MLRKKIAEIRAKRKEARAEAKKLMKKLGPVLWEGIKVYAEKKYGVKI